MPAPEKHPIEVLNPLSFPLYGARLIEASAGTGKTFTICTLYLRLLLGHGTEDCRHPYPLTVDQILVVTFTEAATEELRFRIRTRIKEARYAFLKGDSNDPLLKRLLEDTQNHQLAANLLLHAERQMDESAIFTIHGFCQRMLVNNAFESGSLFETSFLTDESKLRQQVVSDYWRTRFYQLPEEISAIIRSEWKTPSDLLQDINPYLSGSPVYIKGNSIGEDIQQVHKDNLTRIFSIKSAWLSHSADIVEALDRSDINRRSYTKKSLPNWINLVTEWAHADTRDYFIPSQLEKFRATVLQEKSKATPPQHPLFDKIETFYSNPVSLTDGIMKEAIERCRVLLKAAKEKIYVLAFDDLLTQLNDALQGDQSKLLAKKIRSLYPVAMIDEFQDTDPLQYNIFSAIYRTKLSQQTEIKAHGIFMIGDPKQAIYAFRGADIFTYIQAKREVKSHFTLNTNWRSSHRMIHAVNSLFMHSPDPFIFNQDIVFRPAQCSPKSDALGWKMNGITQPALTLWLNREHPKLTSKSDYIAEMSDATVEQIHVLLSHPAAHIVQGDDSRNVQAGDIAILVRTSHEARIVRQKLSDQNIASVYLSNRDSVFATKEAHDILRILSAINEPSNDRRLKPALATHLLGENAESFVALEHHEHLLEEVMLEFSEYARIWEKKGILPALRQIFMNRKIAERLLTSVDGERKVADFLHIAELLQAESQKTTTQHGMIRWLTEKIEKPDGNAEEQQVRLESENDLVKVITIHKSKGLEYPFVFLPFLATFRESETSLYHDEVQNQTVLDTKKGPYATSKAEKERLAEDLRLLYVAVTRAVYGCFIGLAPIANGRKKSGDSAMHKSAIGWILQQGCTSDPNGLLTFSQKLDASCEDICLQEPPRLGHHEISLHQEVESHTVSAQKNNRQITENWYVTSFSALSMNALTHRHAEPEFAFEEGEIETEEEVMNIFNFHKGAKAGTFLHSVFEHVDYSAPSSEKNKDIIKELLFLAGYDAEWAPVIQKLVHDVLFKPMGDSLFQLSQVTKTKLLCEMEFTFPIKTLNAQALANVCKKHDPVSENMNLNFFDVSGMLKGFIDLIFEADGKFYILDWKSNHLGDVQSCYTQNALIEAMQDHRYDLQYQIYSLALHKHLKSRMKDYVYEKHFGGVLYIFLRGINHENNHGIFFTKPTEAFLIDLENLFERK
ncbi:exodeoxyribonuclease V subunit beta [Photobacterium galatheae]|uniref:RecBCD enzyme subunit RecB n=1 Tax=Photobacterium galatheae TaxID=1654360 RepID=A0A066RTJ0_9GAMM|nr:exodeoxyribonuclease V subunit beta [Photobacterium galatheae]KDM91027.1 hypothetical protein EA58_14860 [Photobacterium galatheae]MCM0149021.1 exodeoxyribonuclease V subunit beta [Photobacterium galatheae]